MITKKKNEKGLTLFKTKNLEQDSGGEMERSRIRKERRYTIVPSGRAGYQRQTGI